MSIGEYWEADNQAFEKTNPGILRRMVRTVDPRTGLGSALGSMHSAAGNGDKAGMALSALEAVPLFGALKTIAIAGKGVDKGRLAKAVDWEKFAGLLGLTVGTGLANDVYGNSKEEESSMDNRTKRIDTLNSLSSYGEKPKTPIHRKIVKTEDDLSKASMVDKLKSALKPSGSALDSLKDSVDAPSTAGTLRDGDKRRRKQMSDAGA